MLGLARNRSISELSFHASSFLMAMSSSPISQAIAVANELNAGFNEIVEDPPVIFSDKVTRLNSLVADCVPVLQEYHQQSEIGLFA